MLKTAAYYEENKKKFNKKHNEAWKRFSWRPCIGDCSYIYHCSSDKTYDGFWDCYSNTASNNLYVFPNGLYGKSIQIPVMGVDVCDSFKSIGDISKIVFQSDATNGRSVEQILCISFLYRHLAGDYDIPLIDYFDDVVNHVVIETVDGHYAESVVEKVFRNHGIDYESIGGGDLDAKYNVDGVVYGRDGLIRRLIQIKPLSTFRGNNNRSLITDRKNFFQKERELFEDRETYGIGKECDKIDYILYDRETTSSKDGTCYFAVNPANGKMSFRLDELCNADGTINKWNFSLKKAECAERQ